jgi:AcrR family transcriptional regulator
LKGVLKVALRTLEQLKAEEREARRRLIADTARDLFSRKVFRDVTVREIAKTAGVSVGTIYNHYTSLGEVFLDVFLENAKEITDLMDSALESKAPDVFINFCKTYVNFLNDNMTFFQMMSNFILGGELTEEATANLNQSMRSMMDRVEKAVKVAGYTKDTRMTAHAVFSSLNGLMISYGRYPGRTPDEIREHTLELAAIIAATFESSAC